MLIIIANKISFRRTHEYRKRNVGKINQSSLKHTKLDIVKIDDQIDTISGQNKKSNSLCFLIFVSFTFYSIQ